MTEQLSDGPPVRRQKLLLNNRLVYTRLRQEILSGSLPPAAKLNIAGLAQKIEVSAGAVREALAMLEADGLVMSEPQRGYRVVPVSTKDLRDLVAARIEIEKLCIANAIGNGDDAWEGAVLAAFHRLSRRHERDSADGHFLSLEWTASHADFHQAIVAGCTNVWLRRVQSILYHQSERYRQLSVPMAPTSRDVQGEHKALVDALLDRDLERSLLLITSHLQTTADLLLGSPFLGERAAQ